MPGDLVLLDDNATDTGRCASTTDAVAAAPPSLQHGKDDVLGADSSPSASGLAAARGTDTPSGVGDVVVSCAAETETAASEPNRPGAGSPRSNKGVVSVLTREVMDSFASQGVTPRDLLRRVVLPLAGTSVQYPHHGVSVATHLCIHLHCCEHNCFSVLRVV